VAFLPLDVVDVNLVDEPPSMNPIPDAAELLRVVRVKGVSCYLTQRNWRAMTSRNPDVLRFAGPTADSGVPIVAVIPVSEDFDDYPVRTWELISLPNTLEERPEREVLRDIVLSGARSGRTKTRLRKAGAVASKG
jgi:hypothetical protein